jgi:hypothetical protein
VAGVAFEGFDGPLYSVLGRYSGAQGLGSETHLRLGSGP